MNKIKFVPIHTTQEADLLILPMFLEEGFSPYVKQMNANTLSAIQFNLASEKFVGDEKHALTMTTNGSFPIPKMIIIGFGHRSLLDSMKLQELGGSLSQNMLEKQTVLIDASHCNPALVAFGMLLRLWKFEGFKSQKTASKQIHLICSDVESAEKEFKSLFAIYEGVAKARDLTSFPANILFPKAYAEKCLSLKSEGISVDIYDEQDLKKLGAESLLAVGRGSENPPQMVVMQWKGGNSQMAPLAIVGKGVCYDAGGINIKTEHMVEMKWDKAAAGVVVGTLLAAAKLKLPYNIVGVIGLAENMPDGAAMKPGDIITTLSGKTVEIIDTDNEGRLVLADCLTFVQRFSPSVLIDLGTLTMETFGALAGEYAGLFCEDDFLQSALKMAGESCGEKLWSLPMGPAFAKQIESSVADVKNVGVFGFGESSAAAEFLKHFVSKEVKWAHIDIAGVAWTQEEKPLSGSGVTGFGVRLLIELLRNMFETQKHI